MREHVHESDGRDDPERHEYAVTYCGLDEEGHAPRPQGHGWEEYAWERFDYHIAFWWQRARSGSG